MGQAMTNPPAFMGGAPAAARGSGSSAHARLRRGKPPSFQSVLMAPLSTASHMPPPPLSQISPRPRGPPIPNARTHPAPASPDPGPPQANQDALPLIA